MKSVLLRFFLVVMLIAFGISCSSTKHVKSKNPIANEFDTNLFVDSKPFNSPFFSESKVEEKWVDSVYNQMSFDEKVGQLFMVSAYSNKDSIHVN